MENFAVNTLKKDLSFTDDLLIDSTFVLLPKNADLTDSLLKMLKKWGFSNVICEGNISLGNAESTEGLEEITGSNSTEETPKEKISDSIKKVIENSKKTKINDSDQARMEMVTQVYTEYMNYIEKIFTHYATHKEIDKEELEETVKALCIFIKEHRRYILRLNHTFSCSEKNFLVVHSIRSTVLSIAIAQQLHVPLSKMIELGVTCIIHEIGMLRLPPQLYMTDRRLNASEKLQITKHTLLGYSIAKDLNFSLPVQLGILEHHEKSNGSGYPRHLTESDISSTARIISVACTYEAISSPRTYKDDKSSFDALIELIQNKENQFDANVLKALILTVSFYPIGSYVYLSNRKIAQVIDTNPSSPKCPVVQLLTEFEADGSKKIVQTDETNISVLRILSKQEEKDIIDLINEKKKLVEDAQKEVEEKKSKNDSPVNDKKTLQSSEKNIQQKQDSLQAVNDSSTHQAQEQSIAEKEQTESQLKNPTAQNEQNKINDFGKNDLTKKDDSQKIAVATAKKDRESDSQMEEVDINFFN